MTEKTKGKPLACGGKGPCCHVGYPHRHCEHCDVVVATGYSYLPGQLPYVPYRPYWYGVATTSAPSISQLQSANPLPEPASVFAALANGHTCEGGT